MAYRTGYVSNSHQLAQIIHAELRGAGWTLVSGMNTDGTDSVFYSDGEDGYQDIYVRVGAKLCDRQAHGDIQFPASDGYTGYVNFFAYQYFPVGGAASDGTNECGRNGPKMYIQDGRTSGQQYEEYDFFNSTSTNAYGRDTGASAAYRGADTLNVSDGHRYGYWRLGGYDYLMWWDHARNPPTYHTHSTDFFNGIVEGHQACYSRRGPDEPMVWLSGGGTYAGLNSFNTTTSEQIRATTNSIYGRPPWGAVTANYGFILQGIRRTGKKYLYIARGQQTGSFATYDMDENEWYSESGFPWSIYQGSCAVLVPKEATGYDNDIIYVARGYYTKNFGHIKLDEDGRKTGANVTHADAPFNFSGSSNIIYPGGDRLLAIPGNTSTNGNVWSWQFPTNPDDPGTWVVSGADQWWNTDLSGQYNIEVYDHLSSRVGVDEKEITQYWLFIDEDRVVALTKTIASSSLGEYEFVYAGLFTTFSDTSVTTTTNSIGSGASDIPVLNTGLFKAGSEYKIVEIADGEDVTGFNGETRKIGRSERFTVSAVSQSESKIQISGSLINSYASGSKVGVDVQPVGVMFDSMDKLQTVNGPLTLTSKIGDFPNYQHYYLKYPVQNLTSVNERTDGRTAWPFLLRHDAIYDNATQVTEASIRGTLKGVYFAGGSNEEILEYDGQTYQTFGTEAYFVNRIAVGPVE